MQRLQNPCLEGTETRELIQKKYVIYISPVGVYLSIHIFMDKYVPPNVQICLWGYIINRLMLDIFNLQLFNNVDVLLPQYNTQGAFDIAIS